MKKLLRLFIIAGAALALAACGGEDKETKEKENDQQDVAKDDTTVKEGDRVASLADPRLQEPTEESVCEMCNMKVYTKDHELGVFSAQAIKADGSTAFYDDIGCLLNAELAHNETNDKYVRDYNTKEWALVEDVVIVKTEIKSPMNWGYIYFVKQEDADAYIKENPTAFVEKLEKIKEDAKKRREEKMKKQAEEEANNNQHGQEQADSEEEDHSGH
ncbi:nitrous oxide reductase accessory protein NosL [Lysinibacillus sp. 54212]|uniref:nitrous oxide reductase accessory protein NosL n=1 Tax=Lysinibacillus sp. 54212 TaxID=3119829 RepID=UPI002FC6B3B8